MKALYWILGIIVLGFVAFFIWDFYRRKKEEENRLAQNKETAVKAGIEAVNAFNSAMLS